MTDILMPALSPTMEEGTLAKWHVKAGDMILSGDVIAEIETDKATMEVEAVDEGELEVILVPEGTGGVKVNTAIARLKSEGGQAASAQASPPTLETSEHAAPVAGSPPSDARDPHDAVQQRERGQVVNQRAATRASLPVAAADAPAPPRTSGATAGGGERVFASPLARRIAQQTGVDLNAIKGGGPHGRIVLADVSRAQGSPKPAGKPDPQPAPAPASPTESTPSKTLEQLGIAPGSYDLVPLDGMRRTIARRLTDSFRDVPHFPLSIDLEIDRLMEARLRINARLEGRGVKVSVNDLLIKASASALRAVPEANASFSPDGIALHHHADIAVAVAIEGGLITPIIREAEVRTLAEISKCMKDLAERARNRKLKPEEYQGGTFSLSNLGMFGIKSFSSILNQPQGCILSVGVGEKRPIVKAGQLAVATVMTVTLTCDHRVVDGATGARWLQAFRSYVEDPVVMLA